MVTIEQVAEAALDGDGLQLRSLTQDLMHDTHCISTMPRPATDDARILAVAAALLEMLAERAGQSPPAWVDEVGPAPEPIFLVKAAHTMKRLHALCEAEAPVPLRKRRLYAPPNFLVFA